MKSLELIIYGRNDNYQKGYLNRLNFSILYNLIEASKTNYFKFFKITLVDCGSNSKLSDNLYIPIKFKNNIDFIYISKNLSTKKYNELTLINSSLAMNIAARNSFSNYLLFGASDILLNRESLVQIFDYINANKTIGGINLINKFYLNPNYLQKNNSYELIRKLSSKYLFSKVPIYYAGGGAGLILSSTNFFNKIKGFNEYLFWGGGDEEIVIYSRNFESIKNITFKHGIVCYKLPYQISRKRKKLYSMPTWNWNLLGKRYHNWGLGNFKINRYSFSSAIDNKSIQSINFQFTDHNNNSFFICLLSIFTSITRTDSFDLIKCFFKMLNKFDKKYYLLFNGNFTVSEFLVAAFLYRSSRIFIIQNKENSKNISVFYSKVENFLSLVDKNNPYISEINIINKRNISPILKNRNNFLYITKNESNLNCYELKNNHLSNFDLSKSNYLVNLFNLKISKTISSVIIIYWIIFITYIFLKVKSLIKKLFLTHR